MVAIRLYKELLLSFQSVVFALGLELYKRRTPRQQIAEYWEQDQRNQRTIFEAYRTARELFSQYFGKSPAETVSAEENVGGRSTSRSSFETNQQEHKTINDSFGKFID
jgi:hypothetical protein